MSLNGFIVMEKRLKILQKSLHLKSPGHKLLQYSLCCHHSKCLKNTLFFILKAYLLIEQKLPEYFRSQCNLDNNYFKMLASYWEKMYVFMILSFSETCHLKLSLFLSQIWLFHGQNNRQFMFSRLFDRTINQTSLPMILWSCPAK